jgi:hypothetical protein
MHLTSHCLFMALHSVVVLSYNDSDIGAQEIVYWVWAMARGAAEVQDLCIEGGRRYWNSPGNRVDFGTLVVTLLTASLRLAGNTPDDAMTVAARVLYASLSLPVFIRIVQFLHYFKSVGVLTIVLVEMIQDVKLWFTVLVIFTSSFAVFFGTLLDGHEQQHSSWYREPLGLQAIWNPYWAVFGGPHKTSTLAARPEPRAGRPPNRAPLSRMLSLRCADSRQRLHRRRSDRLPLHRALCDVGLPVRGARDDSVARRNARVRIIPQSNLRAHAGSCHPPPSPCTYMCALTSCLP